MAIDFNSSNHYYCNYYSINIITEIMVVKITFGFDFIAFIEMKFNLNFINFLDSVVY